MDVFSMLVVCSLPNYEGTFGREYRRVREELMEYFQREITLEINFIDPIITYAEKHFSKLKHVKVSKEEYLRNFEEKHINKNYIYDGEDYLGKIFHEAFPARGLGRYDIIWFAGCNVLNWIADGIFSLPDYMHDGTIFFFTEMKRSTNTNMFYISKKEEEERFPFPFVNFSHMDRFIYAQETFDEYHIDEYFYSTFNKVPDFPFYNLRI